jgi:hypothetical protein
VLDNDQAASRAVIARISGHSPTASGAIVAASEDGRSLKYLSKPGWVGKDGFTYRFVDWQQGAAERLLVGFFAIEQNLQCVESLAADEPIIALQHNRDSVVLQHRVELPISV